MHTRGFWKISVWNWDQESLKAKEKSPQPGKTSVVKGEDKEGKYEEYIIRRRLSAAQDCKRYDCGK